MGGDAAAGSTWGWRGDCLRIGTMSVAKVIEISSTSSESFDHAVKQGVQRAGKSVRNITSAWVKDMRVTVKENAVSEYQVNMQVTFLLDDNASAG